MSGESCEAEFLPLFDAEKDMAKAGRGVIYAVCMIYFFVGIAIIADMFMAAIEEVTSRRQWQLEGGKRRTHSVWNETVANLSLMALGSSAPEIALSLIELLRNNFYSGELGSSTIVGSAAFNLFTIIAVCILSIPDGETRKITGLNVFYVTAAFSIFAYFWLVVVLVLISPDVVELWEAALTLAFLPVLIAVSYWTDIGELPAPLAMVMSVVQKPSDDEPSKEKRDRGSNLTKQLKEANRATHIRASVQAAGLYQKAGSVGAIGGGRQSIGPGVGRRSLLGSGLPGHPGATLQRPSLGRRSLTDPEGTKARLSRQATSTMSKSSSDKEFVLNSIDSSARCKVEFLVSRQCLSPGVSTKSIILTRTGSLLHSIEVEYTIHSSSSPPSETHTSVLGYSYTGAPRVGAEIARNMVTMPNGEPQHSFDVTMPESFDNCCVLVIQKVSHVLQHVSEANNQEGDSPMTISAGDLRWTYIVKTSTGPGILKFLTDETILPAGEAVRVKGTESEQQLNVVVMREGGCNGTVSCTYRTEKFTALEDVDFEPADDVLEFPEGTTERIITLEIRQKQPHRAEDEFFVILQDSSESVKFDEDCDGGEDEAILTVKISAVNDSKSWSKSLDALFNMDQIRKGNEDYLEQFTNLRYWGCDEEAHEEASTWDKVWHILTMPWMLLFATVPPTAYAGGWLCFYTSLLYIGIVTALVADLADMFGCCLNIPDMVTAITIVALGTSMPDLFASLSAAKEDPTADASVVNVTGSNSVNVFLGLGLPWTLATLYWAGKNFDQEWANKYSDDFGFTPVFVVPSANLGFSVVLFCCCCAAALILLLLRRKFVGCELGGPRSIKIVSGTCLVGLWILYVGIASWWALREESMGGGEIAGVLSGTAVAFAILLGVPSWMLVVYKGEDEAAEALNAPSSIGKSGDPSDLALKESSKADDTDGDPSAPPSHASWSGVLPPVVEEWKLLNASVPLEAKDALLPEFAKSQEAMKSAIVKDSASDIRAAQAETMRSFSKHVAFQLKLDDTTAEEVMSTLLEGTPAPLNGNLATIKPWFARMRHMVAASGDFATLAEALQSDAEKTNQWSVACKVIVSGSLRRWGAPPLTVESVLSSNTTLRGLDWHILSPEGNDPMNMLLEVSKQLDLDPYQDLLRPICKARLTPLGMKAENGSDLLEKVLASASQPEMAGLVSRAILSERASLRDCAALCEAVGIEPREACLRPMLSLYFRRVGLTEQEFSGLLSSILAAFSDEKVNDALDNAVAQRLQDTHSVRTSRSEVPSADLGLRWGQALTKQLLRRLLLEAGILEADAYKMLTNSSDQVAARALLALATAHQSSTGLTLQHLVDVEALFAADPATSICRKVFLGRLCAIGAAERRCDVCLSTSQVREADIEAAAAGGVEAFLLGKSRTLQDLRSTAINLNFLNAPGLETVLSSVVENKLQLWGGDQTASSALATGALAVEEVAVPFSNTFLACEGSSLSDIRVLSSWAQSSAPSADEVSVEPMLLPILSRGFRRSGLSEAVSEKLLEKVAVLGQAVWNLEALNPVVHRATCRPETTTPQGFPSWQAICEALSAELLSIFEPSVELFFVEMGVPEHDAESLAEKVLSPEVLSSSSEALSAILLNEHCSVESLSRVAADCGIDALDIILRPALQKSLTSWGVPFPETEAMTSGVTSIVGLEALFDASILDQRPDPVALQSLCTVFGIDCDSRVFQPKFVSYLISLGVHRTPAQRVAALAFAEEGVDPSLLEDPQHVHALDSLTSAVGIRLEQDLMMPVLTSKLQTWKLRDSALSLVVSRSMEVGPRRQALGILQRGAFCSETDVEGASVGDFISLGQSLGFDAVRVLLKPMIKLRALRWGVSKRHIDTVLAEAVRLIAAGKAWKAISHAVLGGAQPNQGVKAVFLEALGVKPDQVGPEDPKVQPDAEAPVDADFESTISAPRKAMKKKKKAVNATEGPNGEPGPISKGPKKSKMKKGATKTLKGDNEA